MIDMSLASGLVSLVVAGEVVRHTRKLNKRTRKRRKKKRRRR